MVKMKITLLFIAFFYFFSIALTAQEISTSELSKYKVPAKKSMFHDWEGIKVIKGKRCEECCTLEFPEKYGMESTDQLYKLVNIIRSHPIPEHDVKNCWFPTYEYGMIQLYKLSSKYQFESAAKLLISTKRDDFLHLHNKGAFAEDYWNHYYVPTLNSFKNLENIFTSSQLAEILDRDCYLFKFIDKEKIEKFKTILSSFKNKSYYKNIVNKCEI